MSCQKKSKKTVNKTNNCKQTIDGQRVVVVVFVWGVCGYYLMRHVGTKHSKASIFALACATFQFSLQTYTPPPHPPSRLTEEGDQRMDMISY